MQIITSGEIHKGIFIMPYEAVELIEDNPFQVVFPTGDYEETEKPKHRINFSPSYKGWSFEVMEIAGPIVLVKNLYTNTGLVLDSRIYRFIQVDLEYHKGFWKTLGINVAPVKIKKSKTEINESKEIPLPSIKEIGAKIDGLEEKLIFIDDWKKKFPGGSYNGEG